METIDKKSAQILIKTLRNMEEEISSALESIEVISDKELMESIHRGLEDVKRGNLISFDDFVRMRRTK